MLTCYSKSEYVEYTPKILLKTQNDVVFPLAASQRVNSQITTKKMADLVDENERYLNEEDIQQKRVTTGAEKKLFGIF